MLRVGSPPWHPKIRSSRGTHLDRRPTAASWLRSFVHRIRLAGGMQRNATGVGSPYGVSRLILPAPVRAYRPVGRRVISLLAVGDTAEGETGAGTGRYRPTAEAAPVLRVIVRVFAGPLPILP